MRLWIALGVVVFAQGASGTSSWWDGGVFGQLTYRLQVDVTNGPTRQDDYPLTVEINFTEKLLDVGEFGALDEASVRVVRAAAESVEAVTSHYFERAPDFGTISNAHGWVSWIVEGHLDPQEHVMFHIYFDIQAHGVRPEDVPLSWEAVYYNPANKIQGGSLEPEASSVDQSQSLWSGWGGQGKPDSVGPYHSGHWGRWSLALVPGESSMWEALVGPLDPGRSYLMGGYVRAVSSRGDPGTLNLNFSLGGVRPIRFSKEQVVGAAAGGWWRCEVPLPIAPDSSVFSIMMDFSGIVPDTLWVDDFFVYEDPPQVSVGLGERVP